MKQLFEVRTKSYKAYYVLANGFDEAKFKVEQFIAENDTQTLFTDDGSLKQNLNIVDTVVEIKHISDKLIT